MSDGQGPATTRRRLRVELRRLREALELPQADVAKQLDWSLSKLIRIENGTVSISVTDVRALLGVYRAPHETVDDLVGLARSARERRWWSRYRDVLKPAYQEFIGFEADAVRLRQFHPTIVPGLLQIEPYIRALIPALALRPLSESYYEALVAVRLKRQEQILGDDNPTDLTVVVDEAALRRPVGGVEAMRAQLRHLAAMETREAVSIGILPFSAGPHAGMQGAFHVIELAGDADDDVLYLESAQGDVALRDQPDVLAQYDKQLDRLWSMSLTGADAVAYLGKIADELE